MLKRLAAVAALALTLLADEPKDAPKAASLGLKTRAAEAAEKESFKLGDALAGRVNGVIADEIAADGPAAKAGIARGDAVLALDDNRVYSDDDVQDFVRAARPGQKVKVLLRRADSKKEETVEAALAEGEARDAKRLAWQFAGPAQLDAALALAKKEGKRVLVGISGAET